MTSLNQTALEAAVDASMAKFNGNIRPYATWRDHLAAMTYDAVRAYLDALPAAPLPEEVGRVVAELRERAQNHERGFPTRLLYTKEDQDTDQRAAALITQQARALADANARIREMEEGRAETIACLRHAHDRLIEYPEFETLRITLNGEVRRLSARGGNND